MSVPAAGATTVCLVILGFFSREVCIPVAASVVTVCATGVSSVTTTIAVPTSTCWPFVAASEVTLPAIVARAGTEGSATTDPCTVTVLVIDPVVTGTAGSTI
jgi:hypothetical protein